MEWADLAKIIGKLKASVVGNSIDKAFAEVVKMLKESPELKRDPSFIERVLEKGIEKRFEEKSIRIRLGRE